MKIVIFLIILIFLLISNFSKKCPPPCNRYCKNGFKVENGCEVCSCKSDDDIYNEVLKDSFGEEKKTSKEKSNSTIMSDEDLPPIDNSILWQKYRTALFEFMRMGDEKAMPNLMFLTTPIPAEFSTFPKSLSKFLNTIPKSQQNYEETIMQYPDIYKEFLMNLQAKTVTFSEKLNQLGENLATLQEKLFSENNKCQEKYIAIKDKNPITYDQYKDDRCVNIRTAQTAYDEGLFQYESQKSLEIKEPVIYNAFNSFLSARGNFDWEINGDYAKFMDDVKNDKGNKFEVKITSETKKMAFSSYESSFGFGLSVCIYGVTIGVNYQQSKKEVKLTTSEKSFQLILGAKAYRAFPVYPKGGWWSVNVIEKYRNGPFISQPITPYFNKGGRLGLLPKTILVIVGPKIDMFVTENDKNEIEKAKSSSFGVSIGYLNIVGIGFNFGKGSTSKVSKETDKLYRITVEGNSYEPQVLMVDYFNF